MPRGGFRGTLPHLVHAARSLARAGERAASIIFELSGMFPDVPSFRISDVANNEDRRARNLELLLEVPLTQFTNIARLLGCSDPRADVRYSVTIPVTSERTGVSTGFTVEVTAPGGPSVQSAVAEAVRRAAVRAAEKDYFARVGLDTGWERNPDVIINYIECP